MGKDNELLQMVKLEDIAGLTRLLQKFKTTKPKNLRANYQISLPKINPARSVNEVEASSPTVGEELLGTGRRININAQDSDGISGLHQAALMGSADILSLLLESGAAVDIKDNKGLRPIHYAAWQGKVDLMKLLLHWGTSVNEQGNDGETPLHLSCQHGHLEAANQLLCHHANPATRNNQHKTALDLACEYGRLQVVHLLLSSNKCCSVLEESPDDLLDNDRTTCLHLAAKNGHIDIIRLLLKHGVDINRSTLKGTCLHEAALHGRFEVVRILLESGVDVNKPNSYDQTALDIAKKINFSRGGREMKQMLKEAISAVLARAIEDYHNPSDPQALSFREGDNVTVLEQNEDGRWRGVIFGENHTSRSGYFPSTAVVLLDRPVGGMQRSKPLQVKKVPPPIIPEMNTNRNSNPSFTANANGRNSCVTNAPMDDNYPSSPLSLNHNSGRDLYDNSVYITGNGSCPASSSPVHNSFTTYQFSGTPQHLTPVLLSARPPIGGVNVNSAFSQPNSPHPSEEGSIVYTPGTSYLLDKYAPTYQQQTSLEDQGIDVQSPGRDSPSSSGSSSGSGCRHSITSLDSGRASSSAYDGRSGHTYLAGPNQHRLSGHSYESSTSLRQSYHSSSSSLGSMDRLDDNGGGTYSSAQINVCKLLSDGVPEMEVLRRWLSEHRFEEYFHLFVQAGYDMPTISRMTPEDLTAIGITNPSHRKKLKVEIGKLNISDGLPDYIPNLLEEWLQLLRLEEYLNCLIHQGYNTVEEVLGIAWEDLEEIGIQKLGHQKKIMLAIKRVKDIQAGVKRFSSAENRSALEVKCRVLSPPSSGGHYQGYTTTGQDVTLNCTPVLPNTSPASENLPNFHTFHQTASEAVDYIPYGAYGPGSPSHIIYRPDIVAIQVRHPSGARSLENLEDGRENRHRTFLQTDSRWTVTNNANNMGGGGGNGLVKGTNILFQGVGGSSAGSASVKTSAGAAVGGWRRGSFDDGDLTPTNEGTAYEMEGGGTLPRPKVSIKPRPVAKIMAKTRLPSGGDSEVILRDDDCDAITLEKKGLENVSSSNSIDVHSSPRRSLPGSPLNSILRNKKVPPPPPPKRCNSISKADRKSDGKSRGGGDYSNEQLFASCVKSIASKFGLTRKSDWTSGQSSQASSPSRNSSNKDDSRDGGQSHFGSECGQLLSGSSNAAQTPEDEIAELALEESEIGDTADRTPPSPAPGSPVHMRRDPTLNSSCASGDGLSPDLSCSPLFHAKRNESTSSFDSSGSTSSGESNTLPFANENVGTIKQRAIKPHPTLTTLDLACSPRGSPILTSKNGSIPGSRSAPATPKRRSSLGSERLNTNASATTPLKEVDIITDGDLRKPFRAQETGDVLNDIDNMLANLTEELDAMLTSDLQSE